VSNRLAAGKRAAAPPLVADQESRRVIREELESNLLVEAGAGSGKTQMLAERMAAGIASGAYQVEHMAAVTFTRKAASELRGRFHLALENRLRELQQIPNPESRTSEIALLNSALANLERFFAGTIHSFCARLLRERPVESGVSPGFTELDEVQDEELRNRTWREFISSTRAAGDPDMLALLDTGVRPKDLDSAFATICLNEDVEFPPGEGASPDPKPAWKALQNFWSKFERELPGPIDPKTTCKLQKAALGHQQQLRVAKKRLDRPAVIAALLGEWDRESEIILRWWATNRREQYRIRDIVTALHADFHAATVEPYLQQWRQYIYRLSVTLLTRAREYAAAERRRRNSLNYGDLLNLTARVLRENGQARAALQRKYQHLFVDEFQDTDPIQAEIVFLLAADEPVASVSSRTDSASAMRTGAVAAPTNAIPKSHFTRPRPNPGTRTDTPDWRSIPVRPGALFVVGDPKQSIYRFRRADIEIYNTVRERFSNPAVGRVVPLTTNFRSVRALCEWANAVFEKTFPAEPTRHSPRFAPLDPNPERKAASSGGVFTLTYGFNAKELPDEDAAQIARYIRSEVDAGRRKYSDFLILTRKKKDRIVPYAAALEALNIPLEVSGAGAFGESAEVQALTVLLRVLADPQDSLPLVAVLRGPLFGMSDPELFEFRQADGWFSIFYEPKASPVAQALRKGHDAVANALASLRQYYRWTRTLPAGAALDRILEHTGYLALAATTPGGVEAGDLLHAVDRVRQVVEDGGSLDDAADALETDSEFTNEVESLPLEPGRSDVVRLMNLHKAKGLEATVVFLADPAGGVKPRADVHIERRGDKALGWFKVEKKYENGYRATLLGQHTDWEQHEEAEEPFLLAEASRLLYVAATRAREMLVVSRQAAPSGTQAWGILNGALGDAKELRVPAKVDVPPLQPLNCSRESQAEANAARVAADSRVNQPSWSITSVTAEAKHVARMSSVETVGDDDPTRVVAQNTSSHRADAGLAWGTLIHGLLEHAMRHASASREDLRRLAMWLTVEQPKLRLVIDDAIDTIERVAHADFWRNAKANVHSEETPFAFAAQRALTMGVIDLIHKGQSGWRIIDYKTDADGGAAKSPVYEMQTARYREALEACGVEVEGVALESVRLK
jgi:ATP-dependent helicase/nuclease subunit A